MVADWLFFLFVAAAGLSLACCAVFLTNFWTRRVESKAAGRGKYPDDINFTTLKLIRWVTVGACIFAFLALAVGYWPLLDDSPVGPEIERLEARLAVLEMSTYRERDSSQVEGGPPSPVTVVERGAGQGAFMPMMAGFFVLAFVIGVWMVWGAPEENKKAKATGMIMSVGSVLGGVGSVFGTLFGFELGDVIITYNGLLPDTTRVVEERVVDMKQIGRVGPFERGSAVNLRRHDDSLQADIDAIVQTLRDHQRVSFIVALGGADKTPYVGTFYGSNEGLARARAMRVKNIIQERFESAPILTWAGGSTQFGRSTTKEQLENDRYVTVWAAVSEPVDRAELDAAKR